MWINIIQIRVNEKQLKKVDKDKVNKHKKDFEIGNEVFPIDVVKINNNQYCINGNGRHRYFGAIEAGVTMIEVNVLNDEKETYTKC
jgi:hypothetical protein